ncbi:hypothetical protein ACFL4O_02470 [bacterium]
MKRYYILYILVIIFILAGCSVKDRLTTSTAKIEVTPSGAPVSIGQTKQFTATIRNADDAIIRNQTVTWSLSGEGSIDQYGLYSAPSSITKPETVSVYADLSGMRGIAKFRVLYSTKSSSDSHYYFYTDEVTEISNIMLFGTDSTSSNDHGYIGRSPSNDNALIETVTDTAIVYEGEECIKFTSVGSSSVFFKFGTASSPQTRDLSALDSGYLYFAVKTSANIQIKLEWGSLGSSQKSLSNYESGITYTDNNWHQVRIPLNDFTGLDLSEFKGIVFTATNDYFYIDDIYFEK